MPNSKTLAPLNIFSCSWKFWKACNEISNFHVDHFSWIKLDLGDKWPWSWWKKCWKTLRNFSKCLEKFQILTFVDFFLISLIFYDQIEQFEMPWWWEILISKVDQKKSKFDLSGQLTFCLMIQNFHYQSTMVLEMYWAKKLG